MRTAAPTGTAWFDELWPVTSRLTSLVFRDVGDQAASTNRRTGPSQNALSKYDNSSRLRGTRLGHS